MDFQELLKLVHGNSHKWLVGFLAVTLWSCFVPSMFHISTLFIGATPTYFCETSYGTLEEGACFENKTGNPCKKWIYDASEYVSTLVTEWDLVCDRIYYLPLLQGTYFFGVILACLLAGPLADVFGRRPTALCLVLIQIVAAYGATFTTNYWLFLVERLILGGCSHTTWIVILIIALETVPAEKRAIVGACFQLGWKFGFMNIALMAYFVRNHRYLQFGISLFNLIFLFYFWILPESPRWLLSAGRVDEAKDILKSIAKWNKPPNYTEEILDRKVQEFINSNDNDQSKLKEKGITQRLFNSFHDLFNKGKEILVSSILRKRLALVSYPWMVTGMSYYGIFLSLKLVNVSKYLLTVITGLIDIPCQLSAVFMFNKAGRIPSLLLSFTICGLSGLAIYLTETNDNVIRPILIITGKVFSAISFQGLGLLGPELFPTPLRTEAFCIMDAFSKLGAAIAPFVVDLLSLVDYSFPNVFFGIVVLLGTSCLVFLPETKGVDVPETTEKLRENQGVSFLNEFTNCFRRDEHR